MLASRAIDLEVVPTWSIPALAGHRTRTRRHPASTSMPSTSCRAAPVRTLTARSWRAARVEHAFGGRRSGAQRDGGGGIGGLAHVPTPFRCAAAPRASTVIPEPLVEISSRTPSRGFGSSREMLRPCTVRRTSPARSIADVLDRRERDAPAPPVLPRGSREARLLSSWRARVCERAHTLSSDRQKINIWW